MCVNKQRAKAIRFGVQHIGDVALLPKLNCAAFGSTVREGSMWYLLGNDLLHLMATNAQHAAGFAPNWWMIFANLQYLRIIVERSARTPHTEGSNRCR